MILVEDESLERNSLKHCVNWGVIGIRIIGEAANGAQGFALVDKLKPDIVLTDVKMPVMNGIDLSKKIRQHVPETKIIFLSSYDDFEYAQQAIDLNIHAYVLKPVKEAELLRVVKRAADAVTEKALTKIETQNSEPSYNLPSRRKNKQQIANEIEKIIQTSYQSPLTIESIAKRLHFTPNYIGTVFRYVKNISINRFLMKTRVDRAKDLLVNSSLTISDVAVECGFSSLSYFHTTFKKETGLTPIDFRNG